MERLFASNRVTLLATVVNSSVLVLVQWWVVSRVVLLAWLAVMCVIAAGRALLGRAYRIRKPDAAEASRWGVYYIAGTVLAGVGWGVAGIIFFPSQSAIHQAFTAFVIGGMVAGATATLSALQTAFYAFALPAVIPITVRSILVGDGPHLAMAFLMVVFLVLMIATSQRIHRVILRILRLRA